MRDRTFDATRNPYIIIHDKMILPYIRIGFGGQGVDI